MKLENILKNHFKREALKIKKWNFHYYHNLNPENSHRPLIILNYGLLCSFEHFKYQIHFFQSINWPVLICDYRGHGLNIFDDMSLSKVTFSAIADDYLKIAEHLKIKSLIPIGHSMGVNISTEMALRAKEKTKGLVLISGTLFPPQDIMFNSKRVRFIQPILEGLMKQYPDTAEFLWKKQKDLSLLKKIVHLNGFNYEKVSKEFIDIYLSKLTAYSPKLFFHLLNQMKDHTIINRVHEIKCPVLLMTGDKDKIIPAYTIESFQQNLDHSEVYIIPSGSHVPQVDDPKFVNERINIFLTEIHN